jgi:hypothetical protein
VKQLLAATLKAFARQWLQKRAASAGRAAVGAEAAPDQIHQILQHGFLTS